MALGATRVRMSIISTRCRHHTSIEGKSRRQNLKMDTDHQAVV
jgi:hypothetical protein